MPDQTVSILVFCLELAVIYDLQRKKLYVVISIYNYTKLLMSWMALRMKWHNQCLRWEAGGQGRQCDGFSNSLVPLF